MEQPHSKSHAAWPIAVLAASCLAFAPVLGGQFLEWDDRKMVVGNPILGPGHFADAIASWTHPVLELYAPLSYTLYALLAAFSRAFTGELQPAFFHSANLLLHFASAVLLWRLLARWTDDARAALLGALLWTLHPMQVEPVAWIASLNTCLCTTLAIAAMLAQTIAVQRSSRPWGIAAAALFVLSLCAKPASIGLPLAIVGVNRFILQKSWRFSLQTGAAAVAIAIPFILIGSHAQPAILDFSLTPLQRLAVVSHALAFYVWKGLLPYRCAVDYGYYPPAVLAGAAKWAGLALVPVAALLAWQGKHRPWVIGCVCLALAVLGPTLGVRDFTFQTYSTVADRYANFALVGLAAVIAFLLRDAGRWPRVAVAGVALLFAALSFNHAFSWQNNIALRDDALRANPKSLVALTIDGALAEQRNDLPGIEAVCRQFLAQRPGERRMNQTLAYTLIFLNRPAESIPYFELALKNAPPSALANARLLSDMGLALSQAGRYEEALRAIDSALQLTPGDATKWANKGQVLLTLHQPAAAREAFERALRINPGEATAQAGLNQLTHPQ